MAQKPIGNQLFFFFLFFFSFFLIYNRFSGHKTLIDHDIFPILYISLCNYSLAFQLRIVCSSGYLVAPVGYKKSAVTPEFRQNANRHQSANVQGGITLPILVQFPKSLLILKYLSNTLCLQQKKG